MLTPRTPLLGRLGECQEAIKRKQREKQINTLHLSPQSPTLGFMLPRAIIFINP